MSDKLKTPWWRQLWPWLLISGPAVVVVAGLVTMRLAFSHADEVIRDGYVKQGLAIVKTVPARP